MILFVKNFHRSHKVFFDSFTLRNRAVSILFVWRIIKRFHIISTTSIRMKAAIFSLIILMGLAPGFVNGQDFLPPARNWKGKSENLIASPKDIWCTPSEKSGFNETPDYQTTINWLTKLCSSVPFLKMVSIGKSPEGRDIQMVVASLEMNPGSSVIKSSKKPCLLVQAGIHSGEIDGKDAGLMLLRDLAFGPKKALLEKVNLLFIPILNVDGHERNSPFSRPNQRGPQNMGWRTNAQNLNLNRDYAKADTREIRAVLNVINTYDPDFYMDIHVTDGADYQFDVTYGFVGSYGHSPSISAWLKNKFSPEVDRGLKTMGHIPGPLLNPVNWIDFAEGIAEFLTGPNFSNVYADLRHLPGILVENHSLKPYKQRVLGTYVLLEETMKLIGKETSALMESITKDESIRSENVVLTWKAPDVKKPSSDSIFHLGFKSKREISDLTGGEVTRWSQEIENKKIPFYDLKEVEITVKTPKGYWVPSFCTEVLERLKFHGIQLEISKQSTTVQLGMYRIKNPKFNSQPFEGRIQVKGNPIPETQSVTMPAGSAWISTDQPLGELASLLLEPACPESFLQWGFFHSIFQKTEYTEAYFMEPLARKMIQDSPSLKEEFEQKKKEDPTFAQNADAILNWFNERSPYCDKTYLLYPVGRVE